MTLWIIGIALLILVLVILDREIYHYEGTHLGPRIQGWLYDGWAAKYDKDKKDSQKDDLQVLAPLIEGALAQIQSDAPLALALDVATGTARLPACLLGSSRFSGNVIGLDVSLGMLERAAAKLPQYKDRLALVRHPAVPLPFPDESFDLVSCLEALEIMPNMQEPLAELMRVLRPGGILITSRGRKEWRLSGKTYDADRFISLLEEIGFEQVKITPWWNIFDLVQAFKPGALSPAGNVSPIEILGCQVCGRAALKLVQPDLLRCQHCGAELPINASGIITY